MNRIEQLPNVGLLVSAGPVSKALLTMGIDDLHGACRLVRLLPYGPNGNEADFRTLLAEGRGTCTAKHGIIATLAGEYRLDIVRVVGFYRLTDDIQPGADEICRRYGIPFVPQTHCLLQYRTSLVDLTEGNCTGKKKLPDRYDILVRVPPQIPAVEERRLYRCGLIYYCKFFPELRLAGRKKIVSAMEECRQLWRCALESMAEDFPI